MGAEVKEAQRRQRGRGVDATADEIPEDVDELVVVQTLALEFELCQEARQVVRWIGPSGRREFQEAVVELLADSWLAVLPPGRRYIVLTTSVVVPSAP